MIRLNKPDRRVITEGKRNELNLCLRLWSLSGDRFHILCLPRYLLPPSLQINYFTATKRDVHHRGSKSCESALLSLLSSGSVSLITMEQRRAAVRLKPLIRFSNSHFFNRTSHFKKEKLVVQIQSRFSRTCVK